MIFYFSGTGNSKGIARLAAEYLNDRAVDLVGFDPRQWNDHPEEILGFVFPIYAYAAPEMVLQFAEKIQPSGAFTFGICTFSNVVGEAMEQFSQILPLKAAYGIKMPDNYPITDHVIETTKSTLEKLRSAQIHLEQILPRIASREECTDVLVGENGHANTYELAPKFNQFLRKTAPFWVDPQRCVGCGLCEKLCPAKAIQLSQGNPRWIRESCCMCMACINRCPEVAIEYGQYSRGRFRYFFKGFDTSRYFRSEKHGCIVP